MSIALLIDAAEFLERREREQEHGYATSLPVPLETSKLRATTVTSRKFSRGGNIRKSQGNRSTHNELEKNRRAHLRSCLERLKDIVPLGSDTSRHTTLGLLTKAKRFIKNLERKEKHQATQLEQLTKKQIFLKWRCEQLISYNEALCKRRSVSECSTSTISSTNSYELTRSSSSICESDEIDVIGQFSQSDSDDHLSVQSLKSGGSVDSGVVLKSTSRLTLSSAGKTIVA
ncbi:hypothetical protein PVAND_014018 [Polypedilum vanderplanki]|uniref:BHLH domain-containing protein n=1 Tax=Polypedilum vanderplanki TaxID=319348 RepID=A0A9J6CRZ7_POLVA|nr:hypothetical protein PVAND_014018 [Polypedilum vanderplanki]